MKSIVAILFILLTISSCKQGPVWSQRYKQEVYQGCYAGTSKMFPDTAQRRKFCLYILKNFETNLPNGLASVSKDSLNHIYQRLAIAFTKTVEDQNIKMTIPWTASAEATLRKTLLSASFIQKIEPKGRQKFCDCLVQKIRNATPDSLKLPLPDSAYMKVMTECKKESGMK